MDTQAREMDVDRRGQSERTLWCAVVNQALEDIRECPINSILFNQAVAFLVGNSRERSLVADYIGVHADALKRCGERLIRARRIAEGVAAPAVAVARAPTPTPTPVPEPRPAVVRRPGPVVVPRPPSGRTRTRADNPFNPYRRGR